MFDAKKIELLEEYARQIRIDSIRMLTEAGSGHPGGSLSVADLVAALMFEVMKHDPKRPDWEDRDRFVMSKGHCIPAWYSALAQAGYIDPKLLPTLRKLGSPLQGHPDRVVLPCLEASTGSLGQGLSIAVGMALTSKMKNNAFRVYCMLGDGEIQEGQVWEAAMSAAKFGLDSLVAIVDHNGLQIDGFVEDVMPLEPLADKWRAFNWHVISIDGHDFAQILAAFKEAADTKGKPTAIIAKTVKGKGVSFMENLCDWHGVAPNREQEAQALAELGAAKSK